MGLLALCFLILLGFVASAPYRQYRLIFNPKERFSSRIHDYADIDLPGSDWISSRPVRLSKNRTLCPFAVLSTMCYDICISPNGTTGIYGQKHVYLEARGSLSCLGNNPDEKCVLSYSFKHKYGQQNFDLQNKRINVTIPGSTVLHQQRFPEDHNSTVTISVDIEKRWGTFPVHLFECTEFGYSIAFSVTKTGPKIETDLVKINACINADGSFYFLDKHYDYMCYNYRLSFSDSEMDRVYGEWLLTSKE